MAIPANLSLLVFPQRWDGTDLELRLLALPKGDPLSPLVAGAPAFAEASLSLDAVLIPSLARLPDPADAAARLPLTLTPPADPLALFEEVNRNFVIRPAQSTPQPRPKGTSIRKWLPPSYREAFAFTQPRTSAAVVDNSYECALSGAKKPKPPGPPPSNEVSWGQVIGFILRQPLLASAAGLLYETKLALPQGDFFKDGGWIYLDLNAQSDYAAQETLQPGFVVFWAARLPELTAAARQLFAPVLFPVTSGPPPGPAGAYDEVFIEAESYDDGFAKIVHGSQPVGAAVVDTNPIDVPPQRDEGIRLGWDDEQIAIWLNRQITPDAVDPRRAALDAPMGTHAYRVDVREAGTAAWHSLVHVQGVLQLGPISLGRFDGERGVEALPVQLDGRKTGEFWMPSYLTTWTGASLVVSDPDAFRVADQPGVANNQLLQAVNDRDVPLRYGQTYQFRVRLMDLSSGGPSVDDRPINPAPAPVATVPFRRGVPPGAVRVQGAPAVPDPANPRTSYTVLRPLLGYPDAVFADVAGAVSQLIADLPAARAEGRAPGLPDPDVTTLEITVEVRGLALDDGHIGVNDDPYQKLYTTTRDFPAQVDQPLDLQLDFRDVKNITRLLPPPAAGALPVPTARDVRLVLTPVAKPDPLLAYFGSENARRGLPLRLFTRSNSTDERGLFVPDVPAKQLQAILLQPDPVPSANLLLQLALAGRQDEAASGSAERLASQLDLVGNGLTYSARPGRRVVFGCSKALPHTLSPDASSIALASRSELTRHWVVVIMVKLDRDWTWDGLSPSGFEIRRGGTEVVGTIEPPRTISQSALANPDRSTTYLFFDAIDPKPRGGVTPREFPHELDIDYQVIARFKAPPAAGDPPLELRSHLPIAAPPVQAPKLAAAGFALSPYSHSADYSSTDVRHRALWLEFADPLENPRDAFFARVLAYAPDPMLTRADSVPDPAEPPLPVDPEPIRVIVPGQSDDEAGLDAMQRLIPSTSPRHFLVPLPPGVNGDAADLFGFFVYELRVGHFEGWSTAQARFGPPLRVTGVQHPAAALDCQVQRFPAGIRASANFATPVFEGRNLFPFPPATEIWVLLYAQVTQMDGASRRNILLGQKPATAGQLPEPGITADLKTAFANWDQHEIESILDVLALRRDSRLSVLAVELVPENHRIADPMGASLGLVRMLRTSTLTAVPPVCVD